MRSDLLRRIKRAVLARNYAFSEKALLEMEADGLTELDAAESILNAAAIYKTLRSQSPWRQQRTEYLHVIQSTNLDGLMFTPKVTLRQRPAVVPTRRLPDPHPFPYMRAGRSEAHDMGTRVGASRLVALRVVGQPGGGLSTGSG